MIFGPLTVTVDAASQSAVAPGPSTVIVDVKITVTLAVVVASTAGASGVRVLSRISTGVPGATVGAGAVSLTEVDGAATEEGAAGAELSAGLSAGASGADPELNSFGPGMT